LLPFTGQFDKLLRDGRPARDNAAQFQIAQASGSGCLPIDSGVVIKTPIFERNSYARQPVAHFIEFERD
jgi:hypothetical protein